jgi:Fe-S-cluster containining protein
MTPQFNCRCCGHCCLNLVDAYNGCVSDADLQRWKLLGREDILTWVETLDLGPGNLLHTAWIDPQTGEDVERCPWLLDMINGKGYLCGIEPIKPDHCRAYPEHRKHAAETACPGYNQFGDISSEIPEKGQHNE